MDNTNTYEVISKILMNVSKYENPSLICISADDNLFGYKNAFTSRAAAYALLEIERKFNIDMEQLIKMVEQSEEGFTVNGLVKAVTTLAVLV